jgi:hypothetical protein
MTASDRSGTHCQTKVSSSGFKLFIRATAGARSCAGADAMDHPCHTTAHRQIKTATRLALTLL